MSRQIQKARSDHVGRRCAQWKRELPDVDTVGMAILGRARWITLQVRPPIEAVFQGHGIDTGEFDVLATLLRSGAPYRVRPTELFRSLMVSSGGMTDRLIRLERAKLIKRASDPEDARSKTVELTARGRELAEAAFREDMAIEAQMLVGLSAAERRELSHLLEKLSTLLARSGSDTI